MSEQIQPEEQPFRLPSKEQALAVGGTLLASGLIDVSTHWNMLYTLGGLVAAYAVGKLTPEVARAMYPGGDPDATIAATKAIAEHIAPMQRNENLPQDTLSKIRRLLNLKSPESPARPKDEPIGEMPNGDTFPVIGPIAIPQAPKFSEMSYLITPNRLVLCWTTDGPVFGTVEDLLSMAIIGKPGRGKTTALIYYVAMLLQANAEVHVWDPHGSMSELDGAFTHLHYTDDLADIPASMDRLRAELESRRLLYKRTKQVKHPLLLLVDELPVIGEYSKSAFKGEDAEISPVKLISDFVLQARKWNCYFIGAGQSTDAEILPTRVTENLSSRIVFYSSTRRATMAGIDLETAKKFLPLLKDDNIKGKMIFDCSRFSEPILGAIPYATISDVQQFLGVQSLPVQDFEEEDDEEEEATEQLPTTQIPTTLDGIMALYMADKIDSAMFQRLVDALPGNDAIETEPLRLVPQPEKPALSPELQKALAAYQDGYNTARPLGEQLGCGKTKAAELIIEMENMKLIERRKRV